MAKVRDRVVLDADVQVLGKQPEKDFGCCVFCGIAPAAGPGRACRRCLEIAARFAAGDNQARFELCRMAGHNVLRSELAVLDTAYATQDAAYREKLERLATLTRIHATGVGRPSKGSRGKPQSHVG